MLLDPFLAGAKLQLGSGEKEQARAGLNLFAIEIDQDLRFVLSGKGFSVLAADFFEFNEPQKFDAIVMNPPFSQGDSAVLHAWAFVKEGGELSAVLNKETLNNPYTKKRQLLKSIVEEHGAVIQLGQAFNGPDSRRKTNVEVILITLKKPKSIAAKFQGFDPNNFQDDATRNEEFAASPLAKTDYVKALCDRYKAVELALVNRHKSQETLDFYLEGLNATGAYFKEQSEQKNLNSLKSETTLEDQLFAVKIRFWEELFSRSRLAERATSNFREKFMDFAKSQVHMSFTYRNCLEVLISVLENQDNIFRDAIDSLFKIGCEFDSSNRIHWEGWKSNDSWKWNKTLIIPYSFIWDKRFNRFSRSVGSFASQANTFLEDLDKILSIISDCPVEVCTRKAYTYHVDHLGWPDYEVAFSSWIETSFVRLRIYKKGTLHIQILDPSLLAEFNRRAAEGKPWMPQKSSYKQPKYRVKQLCP